MKKQFENNNFILYSPDTLKYITNNMEDILNNSLELYKKLFCIKEYRQVQINYFDDIISFRKFIYDLRKEKESLPKYAKGTFDKGMINAYIEKDIEINSALYHKKLYMASHELFHIMYDELILKKYNYTRKYIVEKIFDEDLIIGNGQIVIDKNTNISLTKEDIERNKEEYINELITEFDNFINMYIDNKTLVIVYNKSELRNMFFDNDFDSELIVRYLK